MAVLRRATNADIDILFEWANDPVVRTNSFCQDPIPYEDHKAWFARMMADDSVHQYIMMEDTVPAGQVRLNTDGAEAEISYSIAAGFRGKGYGRKILQLTAETVKKEYPDIKELIAKVKADNAASNKLFQKEGYHVHYTCYSLNMDQGQEAE